jgi:hypothetical protein
MVPAFNANPPHPHPRPIAVDELDADRLETWRIAIMSVALGVRVPVSKSAIMSLETIEAIASSAYVMSSRARAARH